MHRVVQATTRMPGPSTAEPVVKECRKPKSPVAIAARTSGSGTLRPWLMRRSKGLFASSDCGLPRTWSVMSCSVKCPADDVHLLFAVEANEIDGIAGDPDCQAWIFLGMVHRIDQGLAIEDIHIHVIAGAAEKRVQYR